MSMKAKCSISATTMWPFVLLYSNTVGMILPVVSTLAFCYVSFAAFKWLVSDTNVPIRDITKRHNWKSIRITAKAWYCSICECLLVNGFGVYCDCCGVCADQDCVKKADRKLVCKRSSILDENMPHHWVKGNLPLGAVCYVCGEDCSMEPGLVDRQCCWCQRCAHTPCINDDSQICDFGPFRSLIVPPWCIQVASRRSSVRKHLLIRSVRDTGWPDWTPLIVVANCKSGNGDGAIVLSEFRRVLNPAQVLDLSERLPDSALQWCNLVAPRTIKLLAAGGDGTVAWVLSTIHKMHLKAEPSVAIVPLGTGNDLSRVLGWGKQHSTDLDVTVLMQQLMHSDEKRFDRWSVQITPFRHLGIRLPSRAMLMYNYFSVGVDAQVALDFHRTRESRLYLFSNRIFNKLLYLCFGTHQVMAAGCRNLEQRLELFLDGVKADLPELEAVIVLNISSWGAGVNLWGAGQAYDDQLLEVVGIYSSFHMAQLQVGLATPHKIGQAKQVEIRLLGSSAVQVDGEPWEQHPASIQITVTDTASVLVNNNV